MEPNPGFADSFRPGTTSHHSQPAPFFPHRPANHPRICIVGSIKGTRLHLPILLIHYFLRIVLLLLSFVTLAWCPFDLFSFHQITHFHLFGLERANPTRQYATLKVYHPRISRHYRRECSTSSFRPREGHAISTATRKWEWSA